MYHLKDSSDYFKEILGSIDWNFPDLQNEGLHSLHWYPATFLSAIPGTLIPLLTSADELVIDPFCGTCTTGLEAIRLGRRFLGADTNPVASLISKAKLLFTSKQELQEAMGIDLLSSLFLETRKNSIRHPNETELLKWYHPTTFRELAFLLSAIRDLKDKEQRTIAQAIFSSILKTASSQARHWGWVCDNVTPKPGEIQYKNAFELYKRSLEEFLSSSERLISDMKHRGVSVAREDIASRWSVECSDAVSLLTKARGGSASLIITSPPYYGVADYIKSQRLSFLWFSDEVLSIEGFSTLDFERLRGMEVGSRSFRWRQKSLQEYIDYMGRFLIAAHKALKVGGLLALVTGDSDARESTTEALDRLAEEAGFRAVFSIERDIKKTRRRLMAKVKHERVAILERLG